MKDGLFAHGPKEEVEHGGVLKGVPRGAIVIKDGLSATVPKKRTSVVTCGDDLKTFRCAAILKKDKEGRALDHDPKEEGKRHDVLEGVPVGGYLEKE